MQCFSLRHFWREWRGGLPIVIAAAARRLAELRDNWLNPPDANEAELKKHTLTNLYNLRPSFLNNAHRILDQAVLDAYGWSHDSSDEEILARLLALNFQRAAQGSIAAVMPVADEEQDAEAKAVMVGFRSQACNHTT